MSPPPSPLASCPPRHLPPTPSVTPAAAEAAAAVLAEPREPAALLALQARRALWPPLLRTPAALAPEAPLGPRLQQLMPRQVLLLAPPAPEPQPASQVPQAPVAQQVRLVVRMAQVPGGLQVPLFGPLPLALHHRPEVAGAAVEARMSAWQ